MEAKGDSESTKAGHASSRGAAELLGTRAGEKASEAVIKYI